MRLPSLKNFKSIFGNKKKVVFLQTNSFEPLAKIVNVPLNKPLKK